MYLNKEIHYLWKYTILSYQQAKTGKYILILCVRLTLEIVPIDWIIDDRSCDRVLCCLIENAANPLLKLCENKHLYRYAHAMIILKQPENLNDCQNDNKKE